MPSPLSSLARRHIVCDRLPFETGCESPSRPCSLFFILTLTSSLVGLVAVSHPSLAPLNITSPPAFGLTYSSTLFPTVINSLLSPLYFSLRENPHSLRLFCTLVSVAVQSFQKCVSAHSITTWRSATLRQAARTQSLLRRCHGGRVGVYTLKEYYWQVATLGT